jgi:dynein heavy chain
VIGLGSGSPDGFLNGFGQNPGGIDHAYLDGISMTRGSPRQHIWSFGNGHGGNPRCPCDNTNRNQAPLPPYFVGNDYFCDGGHNGALWDGAECNTPCCTFNSPPWFNVTLPAPTSDTIEVRICADQTFDDEKTQISVMDIYVK